MDVMSGRSSASALNPDAPLFVPWAYRTVEDFSEQWWELVKSSAWFRDYWLRECFEEEEQHHLNSNGDYEPFLPDIDDLFDDGGYRQQEEKGKGEKGIVDLIPWGAEKWRGPRSPLEGLKHSEKAPRIVNVKVSPRMIQQPR